jgi:hypothetical protein
MVPPATGKRMQRMIRPVCGFANGGGKAGVIDDRMSYCLFEVFCSTGLGRSGDTGIERIAI